MGFDDSVLEEKRFPTKKDLDKVSTEHPVMIIHISGQIDKLLLNLELYQSEQATSSE